MRTYACLYDRETNEFSIIFYEKDNPFKWFVLGKNLSENSCVLIVDALNKTTS